jgi:hypothetical protein
MIGMASFHERPKARIELAISHVAMLRQREILELQHAKNTITDLKASLIQ